MAQPFDPTVSQILIFIRGNNGISTGIKYLFTTAKTQLDNLPPILKSSVVSTNFSNAENIFDNDFVPRLLIGTQVDVQEALDLLRVSIELRLDRVLHSFVRLWWNTLWFTKTVPFTADNMTDYPKLKRYIESTYNQFTSMEKSAADAFLAVYTLWVSIVRLADLMVKNIPQMQSMIQNPINIKVVSSVAKIIGTKICTINS